MEVEECVCSSAIVLVCVFSRMLAIMVMDSHINHDSLCSEIFAESLEFLLRALQAPRKGVNPQKLQLRRE